MQFSIIFTVISIIIMTPKQIVHQTALTAQVLALHRLSYVSAAVARADRISLVVPSPCRGTATASHQAH